MTPLLTVLALRDAQVHIGSLNGRDIPSDVEVSVD